MGIFDRARRIAESYLNDTFSRNVNLPPDSDDEELRRIIDELTRDSEKKSTGGGAKNTASGGFKNNSSTSQNPQDGRFKNACATLGIAETASVDEIKSAFKRKMRIHHPDKAATLGKAEQAAAHTKAQEISEAYQFLKEYKGF
ncbi:MAG TPA: DnaJ domain-containing protein [Patescibacteria group bacterium]|nr:DnaJ domain-containing protein [Patescibacteria group bacterium]